jgi:hypothetical protein
MNNHCRIKFSPIRQAVIKVVAFMNSEVNSWDFFVYLKSIYPDFFFSYSSTKGSIILNQIYINTLLPLEKMT